MDILVKRYGRTSSTSVSLEVRGSELVINHGEPLDPDNALIETYRSVEEANLALEFQREKWIKEGYADEGAAPPLLFLSSSSGTPPRGPARILDSRGNATRTLPKPLKRRKVRDSLPPRKRLARVLGDAVWDGDALLEATIDANELASVLKSGLETTLRVLRIEATEDGDYAKATKVVLGRALPALRDLILCDFEAPEEFESTKAKPTKVLTELTQLEGLTLRAGRVILDPFPTSPLKRLDLSVSTMSDKTLAVLAGADWPALESLTLWLGAKEAGAAYSVDGLRRLFAAPGLGALRRLHLNTIEPADEVLAMMLESPLLPRLTSFELSNSLVTDVGLAILGGAASRFAHLSEIVMDDILATQASVAALTAAGLSIRSERNIGIGFTSVRQVVPCGD